MLQSEIIILILSDYNLANCGDKTKNYSYLEQIKTKRLAIIFKGLLVSKINRLYSGIS